MYWEGPLTEDFVDALVDAWFLGGMLMLSIRNSSAVVDRIAALKLTVDRKVPPQRTMNLIIVTVFTCYIDNVQKRHNFI